MASIDLGDHFEKFAQDQNSQGRFQSVKAKINDAWDDPRPSRPADEVFGRIEKIHIDTVVK